MAWGESLRGVSAVWVRVCAESPRGESLRGVSAVWVRVCAESPRGESRRGVKAGWESVLIIFVPVAIFSLLVHACNSLLGLQKIYLALQFNIVLNLFSTYKMTKKMSDGPQKHLLVSFRLIHVDCNCCYATLNFMQKLKQKHFYTMAVFFADLLFVRLPTASKLKRSNMQTQHFANIVTPILKGHDK